MYHFDMPIISKQETTWVVKFPNDTEKICGTILRAIEVALEETDTIQFIPWNKVEKAPYGGSMDKQTFTR